MFEVLKYIHENIKTKMELEEISSHFGYSKWYFCSKFHSYTGKSFAKYIRHYRLQLAAIDILSGKKITDVYLEYGYDSLGGFNKAFVAEYGCFPREYKKRAKESQLYYERRRHTMYNLTNRCEILRQLVVGENAYEKHYRMQHPIYYYLGMIEATKKNLSNSEIIASGVANVLNKFTPVIIPGELIVGFNFSEEFQNFKAENTEEN